MAGKLLVGQAGGATAVINSSLAGVVAEAQASGRFNAIWGIRRGAEGLLAGDIVDLSNLSPASLAGLRGTPGAALASSRRKLNDEEIASVLDALRRHDVRAFVYIGGNDSADTVHRLTRKAAQRGDPLSAIAVPKTIDNDLPITDHCPGYGSIARYVAIATMDSAQDTMSMPTMYPVKFIEVMGRNAGWVVAAATLARRSASDPPHLIYPPERRVTREQILADVERVYWQVGWVVAVIAETLRDERGQPFADPAASMERDAFGHPLLRGTADVLCRLIQQHLGVRARSDKPGSLQRMSILCASPVDLAEAEEAGRAAVRLTLQGVSGRMVTIVRDTDAPYLSHMDSAALDLVANRERCLPDEFLSEDGRDTTDAFRRYALPLLGPEPFPAYTRLEAPAVPW